MRNLLLGVIGVCVIGVAGVTAWAAMQPGTLRVERTTVVEATPGDVYPYLDDLKLFVQWSPWSDIDPDAVNEFSTPSHGEQAWYTWEGNDEVGAGKMTVEESVEGEKVVHRLEFTRPFESTAFSGLDVTPEGAGSKVVWWFEQRDRSVFEKATGLFVSMDDMIGGDYEKGLAKLAPLAKTAAMARIEAEEKKAAEEAAAQEAAEATAEGEDGGS